MTNPSLAISKTPTEQLLDKITVTRQAITHQMTQATSELEMLYHLNNQQLITNFDVILKSEQNDIEKKEALKQLLAERWQDIKGTSYAYCEQPREPLNQLCQALALYISPLPEDMAECDDWVAGEGPYFNLMPDLEAYNDIVLNTNIHQYRLHEFILSDDSKRYIPIFETLNFFYNGTSKQPLHTVFTEEQMADNAIDKTKNPLSNSEADQLKNHSEITARLMQSLDILKHPNVSFFNRLNKLADGLLAGSAHGGSGQPDNAAAQANEAIIEFFDYWDSLPAKMQQHYFAKVPKLGPILKRLSDPVTILDQGVAYCVGVTGGDLRHEVRMHSESLESSDIGIMRESVRVGLIELERALQQPGYTLNPVKKDIKPIASRVMKIPVDKQHQLIRDYLHLEYPNFLLYAFDQQPAMIKTFIAAFQKSTHKSDMLQQRTSNGMSVLMIAAQSYPEALEGLLTCCFELSNQQLKDELMATTPSGDSLPLIILQRCPQALPQLFSAIRRLDQDSQLSLLTQVSTNHATMLMMAMESNADAFSGLCELIATFAADDIATLLQRANYQGDTLLMMALRNYPHAVLPLITLFGKCKTKDQKLLVNQVNNAGLNLPFLALNADPKHFQTILEVITNRPADQIKTIFPACSPAGESFFLRASYSQAENFNAALGLLDAFPIEEQAVFFQQQDRHNNHLLLLAMLHQQTPPIILFSKLKSLPKEELFTLLTTRNQDGFSPLTLALIQQPQYFSSIVELISCLTTDQQALIWQQTDMNGWYLPFIASTYTPEHLASVMQHVTNTTLETSLTQYDSNGNGLFAFTVSFQPKDLPRLIEFIKTMTIEHRFRLLSHCNQQGDNLLSWILQLDVSLLDDLFKLMEGFTIEQQVSLLSQRNHQRQHALTIAYTQDPGLLDILLTLIHDPKDEKKESALSELSTSIWFDLLSVSCVNQSTFLTLYNSYRTIHKDNKTALTNLLAYHDANHNNLFMLIIQNNPSLIAYMVRDIKELSDERAQRRIMLQKNALGSTVLSLAEKYTSDHIVASLQAFLKSLDKQRTKRMMLKTAMKMHSADAVISSEILEDYDAERLIHKLNETDAEDNNLLGQIIIRMPHRLPAILKTMQHLLSPEQIRQLFAHQNRQGLNLYWLVLKQPRTGYLCQQIQSVINGYDNKERMTMLAPRAEQTMIESALKLGKTAFFTTMRWVDAFEETQRRDIILRFWQQPSEQLRRAIASNNVDVCQRLIKTTQNMLIDDVVALMLRNREALVMALTNENNPTKKLMCQWLLNLPQNKRFEILSSFSAELILSLLDGEQISLVDTLTLDQQARLLGLQDNNGHNILVKAFNSNHRCQPKLLSRLQLFTPQQQASLFQANEGQTTLLHTLARNNEPLFAQCLAQLQMLSSQTQFTLLSQLDRQRFTPLDYLQNSPYLYEQMLNLYDSLSLANQIQLFSRKGPNGANLLIKAPLQFRQRLFEQFIHFPQSAQIEILLSMNDNNQDSLKTLMQTSPSLKLPLLDIIQSFPTHVQGTLYLATGASGENLVNWMMKSHDDSLKMRVVTIISGLAKPVTSALLIQKNPIDGDNLLQTLTKTLPSLLLDKTFSIFMTLPIENKIEIIAQQNNRNKSLFSDFVNYKCYDQFEQLCKTIAQFPNDEKVRILSTSGIVPIERTTLWVSLLYDAPQRKSFINLMNNKAFYPNMLHLLQTLPPQVQRTILTNRNSKGNTIIDEVVDLEQSQLRLVLKQAEAFSEAKELLTKMAARIPNEQVHDPESNLHQLLVRRLEAYQSIYYKSVKDIHELAKGWATDIEATWPQIENKLTLSNILIGLLKLTACLLMPIYGGYKLYEKITTNRNTIFQTDRESTIYRLEDLATKVEQTAIIQLEMDGQTNM